MSKIIWYQCKSKLISMRRFPGLSKIVRQIYNAIQSKTKRRPYLRSAYFQGEKVFLENFWAHLNQKSPPERRHRLQYFECALELIQKSKIPPLHKVHDPFKKEIFYRFMGKADNQYFMVQIKEDLRRKQKFFMSVFEYKK